MPCPIQACSLCGTGVPKHAFIADYWQAHAVVYGTLANPKLTGNSGQGTTELHVSKVLKADPRLKDMNLIVLQRYLTILNPKEPPRLVVLLDDKLVPLGGREANAAFLDFLAASEAVKGQPRTAALAHFAKYLDHADPSVADDAFLAFAAANDKEVFEAAGSLKPDVFRKLVKDPRVDSQRLALFAFLLGATGGPADGDLLLQMLKKQDDRSAKALEGILAGYILQKPKEGWAWMNAALTDTKQPFLVRWEAVRAMRFLYAARPVEYRAPVLHALGTMISNGELADVAVGDLQKWQLWDHTKLILQQYGKPSHSAPIVRNALLRYALTCPQPEARQFVATLRQREPQLIRELEEDLAFEQGK
jgi:hypothetical protein